MKTLQIGMGWFPEEVQGLNRFYYDYCQHSSGTYFKGLVIGSFNVATDSKGLVRTFAPPASSLLYRWQNIRRMVKQWLKEEDFSVIVTHFALYSFSIADLIGDRPIVMHFQGPWALESRLEGENALSVRLKKALEKKHYQKVAKFIVLSTAFKELLHREYQVPLSRIHVIPPGVDLARFDLPDSRAQARSRLGWNADRPIIFVARRLTQRMGLENLIAAMDKVRFHHPEALLLIAGKGSLAPTLQAQIDSLNLNNQVQLLGFVPDEQLPLAYRSADFSIVPTVDLEGFGLVLIESLAAGTPVLGTPINAIPEVLRPLSESLLLEGSSSEQIAQGILEVFSGVRSLPSSSECQSYVREHYDWSVVSQKIRAVYESALMEKVSV